MNDKIYQLNLTAMSIVLNGDDPDNDIEQMYIPKEFTKKFAELIVKECMNICGKDSLDYRYIKEHFGVEE